MIKTFFLQKMIKTFIINYSLSKNAEPDYPCMSTYSIRAARNSACQHTQALLEAIQISRI
jgi:hypothetical protein